MDSIWTFLLLDLHIKVIINFDVLTLFAMLLYETISSSFIYFMLHTYNYIFIGKTIYSSIESFEAALRPSELECPSDNVIITKYRCQVIVIFTISLRYFVQNQ